jgi:hypothetical protein
MPKNDLFFVKNKEYHYNAVYIDSIGDTIVSEIITLKPLDRRWIGQLRVQETVQYQFETDSSDFVKVALPISGIRINHVKKENTGAYFQNGYYFLHPPRANQYYMLRYAAYPRMEFEYLSDSLTSFDFNLRALGGVKYQHHYIITPLKDSLIFCNTIKTEVWEVQTTSEVTGLSEYWQNLRIHNSTCEAVFSKELGFVKMHHTFENGIKIQFDLIKVVNK